MAVVPITPERRFKRYEASSRVISGTDYETLLSQLSQNEVLVFAGVYQAEISDITFGRLREPAAIEIRDHNHFLSMKSSVEAHNHVLKKWWAYTPPSE